MVFVDNPADNHQSQAGPALSRSEIRLEYFLHIAVENTRSGIGEDEIDLSLFRNQCDRHSSFARPSPFLQEGLRSFFDRIDGVLENVDKGLFELNGISANLRDLAFLMHNHLNSLVLQVGTHQGERICNHGARRQANEGSRIAPSGVQERRKDII